VGFKIESEDSKSSSDRKSGQRNSINSLLKTKKDKDDKEDYLNQIDSENEMEENFVQNPPVFNNAQNIINDTGSSVRLKSS
jgi:hypothetical protein